MTIKMYYTREDVENQVYLILNVLKIRKKDSIKNKTMLTQYYYRLSSCYVSMKLLVGVHQFQVSRLMSITSYINDLCTYLIFNART